MTTALRSTNGVSTLITQARYAHERTVIAQVFAPLRPDVWPWQYLADIPTSVASKEPAKLSQITQTLRDFEARLTATAGKLAGYLDASDGDINLLAARFAKLRLPKAAQKLEWARRLLNADIPGQTEQAQRARINDARFWRRAIRTHIIREREHFFLRLKIIGNRNEAYVSDVQLANRCAQLRRQEQWMKETYLLPRYLSPEDAEKRLLTIADVTRSAKMRFSKLYTFVRAVDELAQEADLAAGLLTLTLEPEWHPNPSHGTNSWNGASPREAHRSIATRWQSTQRDLDHLSIGISGLRVVEPHKDGCPHWHIWLLYKPEAEAEILTTVMKYFPNKLKLRAIKRDDDRMFDCRTDLVEGKGRALTHVKEGAQVELARIDRSISGGASYAMKYLLKTVDGGEGVQGVEQWIEEDKQKRLQQNETTQRVDAYRALWGINSGQLFGIAKCLTAWDQLRRLADAPSHPFLKKLWTLARGSDKPGHIERGSGQRGDAKAFIQALGGLAACGKRDKKKPRYTVGRLLVQAENSYGEKTERAKGITLVESTRAQVMVKRVNKQTGEVKEKKVWRTVKTVLAKVCTAFTDWIITPKKALPGAMVLSQRRFAALSPA
ncbi:hypothetical protein EGI20_08730 [Aquitalea sp. S1-19]|nr:hypothetical protein [Aquitalea sp. S1-19]